ncbi:hypothetical protein [Streptomyces sp. AK08-02]|uniref:hypothetical protein n=1 Tax=Streptomyces sp. AK08-02 TaxID=3028654 RepID=UPI0029A68F56|nr:hypothetical protein [Streptomyces sp. AK08-02]MDX3748780.1 hypothetical protein [Streptomyces sp. AK08-02]
MRPPPPTRTERTTVRGRCHLHTGPNGRAGLSGFTLPDGWKSAFRTDLVFAAVALTAPLSIALFWATYLLRRLVPPRERALAKEGRS